MTEKQLVEGRKYKALVSGKEQEVVQMDLDLDLESVYRPWQRYLKENDYSEKVIEKSRAISYNSSEENDVSKNK